MAKEIERKFLVLDDSYKTAAIAKTHIRQGYLCTRPEGTVRVRLAGNEAFMTIKGINQGCTRDEWEYSIPEADAADILERCCTGCIDKTRWIVPAGDGLNWEIDEFHGRHSSLVIAELELPHPDCTFELPGFVGKEVTGDPQYYNSVLSPQG